MGLSQIPGGAAVAALREAMARRGLSPDEPAVDLVIIEGVPCHLRTLTAEWCAALLRFQEERPDDGIGFALLALSASLCHPDGTRRFTAEQLGAFPFGALDAAMGAIFRINRLAAA